MNNENPNCADGCEGCDQATWMKCHEVEVHAIQCEEVYDERDYSIR